MYFDRKLFRKRSYVFSLYTRLFSEVYQTLDHNIRRVVLQKFKIHLWYLGPEAVSFAIFDTSLGVSNRVSNCRFTNAICECYSSCHKKATLT